MSIFVDASAMVAIIAGEPDGDSLLAGLAGEQDVLWSAMSGWETVSSLRRSHKFAVAEARQEVEDTVGDLEMRLVPIGWNEWQLALDAYERFGRGSRHPARLNMGDCFAYACAKANNARLLFKGDDFTHTDLG